MSYTSRETSPDPLAGPSSPMASRLDPNTGNKPIYRPPRRSSRPLSSRSHNIASPSKSFIMDTNAPGDASPWRIKVTVEAEPHDGSSPTKRVTRTTKVPLKGSSSSPVKKSASPRKNPLLVEESEAEIKRPQRKRKGTPIRRNVKRASPSHDNVGEDGDDVGGAGLGGIEMSAKLQEELSSPTKAPVTRSKPKGTPQPSAEERARRLAKARAQLVSLRSPTETDAESQAADEDGEVFQSDAPAGDMTVANEDFTMISVATLESMKQGNSSLLENSRIGEGASYWPSSPPQTVQAHEEDEAELNDPSRLDEPEPENGSASVYDDMSWKPTGPLKSSSMLAKSSKQQQRIRPFSEPEEEYQREREAVKHQAENASADQVITVDSSHSSLSSSKSNEADAVLGAQEPDREDEHEPGDDDIWAEEASRSLEEEQEAPAPYPPPQQSTTAAVINELFSDGASKPPRGKIPRTWRRTSGMDFSYVDSPAHEIIQRQGPREETRKVSATSTVSSREGEGVLTPPDSSFEEEDQKTGEGTMVVEEADVDVDVDVDVELTHPDAAATQLELQDREPIFRRRIVPERKELTRPTRRNRAAREEKMHSSLEHSTSTNSLNSTTSAQSTEANDDDDTGMFWQTNLPSVFDKNRQRKWGSKLLEERRKRKKANDLSEILRSSSDVSVHPPSAKEEVIVERSEVSISEEKATSHLRTVPEGRTKVVDSPLRKSLLKSSKLGGSTLPTDPGAQASGVGLTSKLPNAQTSGSGSRLETSESKVEGSWSESFESKASDQRQLLTEMNTPAPPRSTRPQPVGDDETDLWGAMTDEQDEQHPMSDASYAGSSPGAPKQAHENLEDEYDDEEDEISEEYERSRVISYEEHLNLDSPLKIKVNFNESEGNSSMLAAKKTYPSLFGEECDHSSEQVVVAKQPNTNAPHTQDQGPGMFTRLTSTLWTALIRPSGPTMITPSPTPNREPTYPPAARTALRARYGVLSSQHPWTMAHMRTLHRLLNSSIANKGDNLVPRSGLVPAALKALVGKRLQCLTTFHWTFTLEHAYVVDAFMQTLVPSHIVEAMKNGEIEFLGDEFSLQYRGFWGGRHGEDLVWDDETIASTPVLRDARDGTSIERSFVVRALGNAVWSNIETAEREEREREESEEIAERRRAWERKMGVQDGDEDEAEGVGAKEETSVERGRRSRR